MPGLAVNRGEEMIITLNEEQTLIYLETETGKYKSAVVNKLCDDGACVLIEDTGTTVVLGVRDLEKTHYRLNVITSYHL